MTEPQRNEPRRLGGSELARVNALTSVIIGAAIAVHRILGPGLLERIYEKAPAITYMRLTGARTGLILNFKAALMKDGIDRLIL